MKDVEQKLENIAECYPEEVRKRVEEVMRRQIRKYQYLIK